MTNNRKRGDRNEYKARDVLIAANYYVTRAAGSLGTFDFIAIPKPEALVQKVRLVQVKAFTPTEKNKGKYYYNSVREEIRQVIVPSFCTKELWIWILYKRDPIIEYL